MAQQKKIEVQLWGSQGRCCSFFPTRYEWSGQTAGDSQSLNLWMKGEKTVAIRLGAHTVVIEESEEEMSS